MSELGKLIPIENYYIKQFNCQKQFSFFKFKCAYKLLYRPYVNRF